MLFIADIPAERASLTLPPNRVSLNRAQPKALIITSRISSGWDSARFGAIVGYCRAAKLIEKGTSLAITSKESVAALSLPPGQKGLAKNSAG